MLAFLRENFNAFTQRYGIILSIVAIWWDEIFMQKEFLRSQDAHCYLWSFTHLCLESDDGGGGRREK